MALALEEVARLYKERSIELFYEPIYKEFV